VSLTHITCLFATHTHFTHISHTFHTHFTHITCLFATHTHFTHISHTFHIYFTHIPHTFHIQFTHISHTFPTHITCLFATHTHFTHISHTFRTHITSYLSFCDTHTFHTHFKIWWSRLADGKEPVCPFAGPEAPHTFHTRYLSFGVSLPVSMRLCRVYMLSSLPFFLPILRALRVLCSVLYSEQLFVFFLLVLQLQYAPMSRCLRLLMYA